MRRTGDTLNVGLLGCGRVCAAFHLPALASLAGARVVAIAEPDESRRRQAARRVPGAAVFDDYRDLLARAELDAVVITLPNPLHAPAALASFARGLHAYVEKPLALDAREGATVIDAWRRSGAVAMIGYNYRFEPQYLEARRLLEQGRLGRLVLMQGLFTTPGHRMPDWKRARAAGGGALLDLVVHHVDLAHWLCGEAPEAVTIDPASRRTEDDTVIVQLRFPSGVRVQLAAALGASETHRFEIVGEEGMLTVEPFQADALRIAGPTLANVRLKRWTGATSALLSPAYWSGKLAGTQWARSFRAALGAFVEGAAAKRQPEPDLQAGQDTLVWLQQAGLRS
jgi:predicted dehydrogenase